MKKKTLVIFVCTLLITTVLPAIGAVNDKTTWYMNDNSYSESNPSTHANPLGLVHIEIVGNVYDMVDADDLFDGGINVGDEIYGIYTYDLTTPDTDPSSTAGTYLHTSAPCGIWVRIGDFLFSTDPFDVDFDVYISNDHVSPGNPKPYDGYTVKSKKNIITNGLLLESFYWRLRDYTCTPISSTALPINAPVLPDWDLSHEHLSISGITYPSPWAEFEIYGHITKTTKTKTRNIYGAESEWSEPLAVSVPKSKLHNFNVIELIWQNILSRFPFLSEILK